MKPRSPVLGYNHNVRYAGRLWHVQTEDSGVSNPHIFTHLFHDGTILATKRVDYDSSSEVGVVQKLMQAQHKAMLRDLKQGAFDDKITRFFGQPVVHEREVTFTFDSPGNRELPQIVGEITVLPKHWWEGTDASGKKRDISATTLEKPLGAGAYRIKDFIPGRNIVYERVPDYWGKDVNVNDLKISVGAVAECKCNGEVIEKAFAVGTKGGIGLQAETGKFEFRHIQIKEMP